MNAFFLSRFEKRYHHMHPINQLINHASIMDLAQNAAIGSWWRRKESFITSFDSPGGCVDDFSITNGNQFHSKVSHCGEIHIACNFLFLLLFIVVIRGGGILRGGLVGRDSFFFFFCFGSYQVDFDPALLAEFMAALLCPTTWWFRSPHKGSDLSMHGRDWVGKGSLKGFLQTVLKW